MKKIEWAFDYEIVISEKIAGAVQSGTSSSWIPLNSLYAEIGNAHTSFSMEEKDELRALCKNGSELELKYALKRIFGSKADDFVISFRQE